MEESASEKRSGCGLLNAVFGKRGLWPKKFANENSSHKTTMSNTTTTTNNSNLTNGTKIQFTKSPGNAAISNNQLVEQPILYSSTNNKESEATQKGIVAKASSNQYPNNNFHQPNQNHQLASYGNYQSYGNNIKNDGNKGSVQQQGRKVPKEAIGLSGELESMIADHQKQKGNSTLVRASSSNVMLFGNLGNIRQPCGAGIHASLQNYNDTQNNQTVKKSYNEGKTRVAPAPTGQGDQSGSLCRAISTRMDPETLKIMGNEDYKNGNFAEALALYDAAISIDPNKASYRSNKSAALTALGRILDAVFECREAIRIEPHYHRAHHRLGNLYLRLGEVEKAIYHYKHSGPEADPDAIAKAKTIQAHLNKCTEVKRLRDWNNLIKETSKAISTGADSAPQVYALQAEALLKIHRHQEAEEALVKSPNFDVDSSMKYYGPIGYAGFLVIRAQVDLAAGRFDDALEAVERAAKLDGNNREVSMVMRRVRAVMAARSKGNELFRAGRFDQASAAYGEGLEHDPRNSVLLCNRAACQSKMAHYVKAVEDCSAALSVRPGYAKARLRRADCNAKLGNLEASIEDYEILKKETQEDEEVARGLSDAQQRLRKHRGQDA